MIEAIMFFALGFLAASLIALVLLSAVWHRAVRLTTRRIEGAIPVSMAEIQADKDQLRAEFAMSTRRLENSVEQLKLKTTEQLADIGRKRESIRSLKNEVEEQAAKVAALEAQERTLRDKLRGTEEELNLKSKALHAAESELSAKAGELALVARALADKTVESDSQKVEIVALETQLSTLKDRITDLEREVASTEGRLAEERRQHARTSNVLSEEREKIQLLSQGLAATEERVTTGRAEAETLARTVASLEAEARRQAELAAERERKLSALIAENEAELAAAREELERSRERAQAARRETESSSRSLSATIEALKDEKSMLEGALVQMREDRDRLHTEVAGLKHEAESAWASERVENALLRERINDVAAEVARLTSNLEGSGSSIERILGEPAPAQRQNGPGRPPLAPASEPDATERPLSLAERIRALQARTSRG
jgi:chromosome segregation ATPase